MLEQTVESARKTWTQTPGNVSVWRDGALALTASVCVGMLAGTALTLLVFVLVAISVGW